MIRDPEQLSDWLSGRHNPFKKNREKIELFLERQEISGEAWGVKPASVHGRTGKRLDDKVK